MAGAEPWVARSRAELLAGAESRVEVDRSDGKSGSVFELVTIDGRPHFAKTLGYRTDWIMRITGDRDLRTLKIWRAGIMRDAPPEIDHAVVGMAFDGDAENEDAMLTILMRDVGEHLFEEGDSTITLDDHLGLIDGLAALSAHYWGFTDDIALTTMEERLRFFAPDNIAPEVAVPDPPVPIKVAAQGWPRLAERAPIHWDLGWYLALNSARLPISKEATIEALRDALERRGVRTTGWFDLQLDLCLLGIAACFGWEKAMGDETELHWWEDRALRGSRHLSG